MGGLREASTVQNRNEGLFSSLVLCRGPNIELRFLEEYFHHPSVPFLDLQVPDTGGGLKGQREDTPWQFFARTTMELR